ncbi:hypothetical protein GCM10011519_03580 [Marmoricola endophyticus]|uniref:Uncharacterized protein n=1 Tax=Marmoricola endophyticus TaxID=2040280 RepID=A0A917EZD7_9ACTN|nr:hypothetical protein [Marmoricola endophyticus]GGF33423.1 hypothetical protein GCM10011519_03580 [Marmoricola endophyticus]
MKLRSNAVVGAALGVVVLALVAVFGIVLPKAHGDESGSAPDLPAKAGGFVALDSGQLPAALQQQIGSVPVVRKAQKEARTGLEKVNGTAVAYRYYVSPDRQALAAVTVVPGDPGLFSPDGPPVAAAPQQQASYQLRKVSGAVCAEYYTQQQASVPGQSGGAAQLSRVHCQLGADGDTYDVDARGLTTAKTVSLLKSLASA